jgi:heat shock protein HslJ
VSKVVQSIFVISILTVLVACGGQATPTPTESSGMPSSQPSDANVPALHKSWQWERRVILDSGKEEQIGDPAKYTLTLNPDGTYQFQADCNQGSGTYVADENGAIRMQAGPVTLAECGSGSRYQDMINMMQAVQDYRLEENGAVLVMVWPAGGPEDSYRAQ